MNVSLTSLSHSANNLYLDKLCLGTAFVALGWVATSRIVVKISKNCLLENRLRNSLCIIGSLTVVTLGLINPIATATTVIIVAFIFHKIDPFYHITSHELNELFISSNQHLIPPNITVFIHNYLYLNDSRLSSFRGLRAIGKVEIVSDLEALPLGLEIMGKLTLSRCPNLKLLPKGLKVWEALNLSNTKLESLPADREDLEIGGDLNLSNCIHLTSLPNWITTLGSSKKGRRRVVDLTGTGLSQDLIGRLRQADAPGMEFYFSHAGAIPTIRLADLEAALTFWVKAANNEALVPPKIAIVEDRDRKNVVTFLTRLTATAEYQNLQARPLLACRVLEACDQMAQDAVIKAKACDIIHRGLASCDDRIISALEQLELMLLLHKLENTQQTIEDLKALGKSFLLLEMVNRKATAHKKTLTWVDEIEIYLAFQIGLADRFKLPVKTRNMFFRGCAQITDAQLAQFGNEIEKAYTDEMLDAFLKIWDPWVKHQRRCAVPAYETLALSDQLVEQDQTCLIAGIAPKQPVLYAGNIYDYNGFVTWYVEKGTDPATRSSIDLKELKRLNINDSTPDTH